MRQPAVTDESSAPFAVLPCDEVIPSTALTGGHDAQLFPCLWFDGKAEEAAKFYTSLLPDSSVDKVWHSPADTPSGPAGMVLTIDFTLNGQQNSSSEVVETTLLEEEKVDGIPEQRHD